MKFFRYILLLFPFLQCGAQGPTYGRTIDPDFERKVNSYLNYTVPVITVDDLLDIEKDVVLLDAREQEEYNVSHIPGAYYIGYKDKDLSVLNNLPRDKKVVVYCSIGYRSEKVAEDIKRMGFENVYNLFGSIFEWANQGNALVDTAGQPTKRLHTYNKNWSKWVMEGKAEKVY